MLKCISSYFISTLACFRRSVDKTRVKRCNRSGKVKNVRRFRLSRIIYACETFWQKIVSVDQNLVHLNDWSLHDSSQIFFFQSDRKPRAFYRSAVNIMPIELTFIFTNWTPRTWFRCSRIFSLSVAPRCVTKLSFKNAILNRSENNLEDCLKP